MSANSVYTLIKSVAGILSPMMAGAIYVMSGLLPILIINSVSFIMATFFESFLSLPKVKRKYPNLISISSKMILLRASDIYGIRSLY